MADKHVILLFMKELRRLQMLSEKIGEDILFFSTIVYEEQLSRLDETSEPDLLERDG